MGWHSLMCTGARGGAKGDGRLTSGALRRNCPSIAVAIHGLLQTSFFIFPTPMSQPPRSAPAHVFAGPYAGSQPRHPRLRACDWRRECDFDHIVGVPLIFKE